MDKRHLAEINSRIKSCLEIENKLDYVDSLLHKKEIGKLEHDVLKQKILKGKHEHIVRNEINEYIEKAVELKRNIIITNRANKAIIFFSVCLVLFGVLLIIKMPELASMAVFSGNLQGKNIIQNLQNDSISQIDVLIIPIKEKLRDAADKENKATSRFEVNISLSNHAIKSIYIADADPSSDSIQFKDIKSKNIGSFARGYAFDFRKMNFTKGKVIVKSAVGNQLYKCKAWNYEALSCSDWKPVKILAPGREYSFNIMQQDAAFIEIKDKI